MLALIWFLTSSRFDDPEGGLENDEFLPSTDGKAPVRFKDVSETR